MSEHKCNKFIFDKENVKSSNSSILFDKSDKNKFLFKRNIFRPLSEAELKQQNNLNYSNNSITNLHLNEDKSKIGKVKNFFTVLTDKSVKSYNENLKNEDLVSSIKKGSLFSVVNCTKSTNLAHFDKESSNLETQKNFSLDNRKQFKFHYDRSNEVSRSKEKIKFLTIIQPKDTDTAKLSASSFGNLLKANSHNTIAGSKNKIVAQIHGDGGQPEKIILKENQIIRPNSRWSRREKIINEEIILNIECKNEQEIELLTLSKDTINESDDYLRYTSQSKKTKDEDIINQILEGNTNSMATSKAMKSYNKINHKNCIMNSQNKPPNLEEKKTYYPGICIHLINEYFDKIKKKENVS